MKYIVKICGNKLEKCDFRNILVANKEKDNKTKSTVIEKKIINNFNESRFKTNITQLLEKKINEKFKLLELKIEKDKKDLESRLRKDFEMKTKKKEEEIKKLKEELNKKIKVDIELQKKKTSNLRKDIDRLSKFKQKEVDSEVEIPKPSFKLKGEDNLSNVFSNYQNTNNIGNLGNLKKAKNIQLNIESKEPSYEELENEFNKIITESPKKAREGSDFYTNINTPVNKLVNDYYYSMRKISF